MIHCKCSECIYNEPTKEMCINADITIIPLVLNDESKQFKLGYACSEGMKDFFGSEEIHYT